jgi:hypothetical protein
MGFWVRARSRARVPWIEVRYEELVSDFAAQAQRLVQFIGRPWSDDVVRFHERASGRAIGTPSYVAVTEPAHTRAVGRWKRYEQYVGAMIDRVGPMVSTLGYEPADP